MRLQRTLVLVLAGSLALALSPAAMAAKGFNYSYVDAGYLMTDGEDVDFNSGLIDASFGLFDLFALRAAYRRGVTDDVPGPNLDVNEFRVGGRLHYELMDKLDIFGDVLGFNAKSDNSNNNSTDIGTIYEAGLRFQAAKKLELNTSYKYVSGDVDEGFGTVGAVFKITRSFALTANGSFSSDINEYFAGLRLNF